MVQGPPTFLRCEPRAGPAVEQDAFVEGRKPRGQHLRFADDAESDAVALPEAVQLAKVPSIKCSFHSASLDMTPHLLQAYLISDRSFLSNTTFDQTSGCSSPQHGHGAFHSPRLLFSYSTSILEAPLTEISGVFSPLHLLHGVFRMKVSWNGLKTGCPL